MLRNGLYNSIGTILNIVLGIISIPLLIHIIGIEEYGLWTLATASLAIAGLAEAGLSISTTVFLSRDLANDDSSGVSQTLTVTIGAMLVLATAVAIAVALLSNDIVALFPKLSYPQYFSLAHMLRIGSIFIWGRLLQQIFFGVLQAHQAYKIASTISVIQSVFISIGLVVVAGLGGRIVEMMIWQVVITLTTLGVLLWRAKILLVGRRVGPEWKMGKAKNILCYSSMSWLVSLSAALFSQVDRLIVGAILGTTAVGIYGAITSVMAKINSLSSAPIQPLLPTLSGMFAQGTTSRAIVEMRIRRASTINIIIALSMGVAFIAFAPWAMGIIIADKVTGIEVKAFQAAALIYALYSLNAVGYYVLYAAGEVKICVVVQLISTIFTLVAIAAGALLSGITGAILGNAGFLGTWLFIIFGMRRISVPIRTWFKWVKFPLIWFVATVGITLTLPNDFAITVPIVLCDFVIIFTWYINGEKTIFRDLYQGLSTRLK